MSPFTKLAALAIWLLATQASFAQEQIKGKIIDASTKEPVSGAVIRSTVSKTATVSASSGEFHLNATKANEKYVVSMVGYKSEELELSRATSTIYLNPNHSLLQELVISANREGVKRTQAPIAIASLSAKIIQDTRPTSIDQVLNKVSGVNMVNLGNEQHQMSIRQPMTTKSLFLYLEDGIPIRTTGLFNHNALLEMNMAAVKSIEVIKGPSSSLYGSEAIGGAVNFITKAPTAIPVLKISAQGNNIGYKRSDLQSSFTAGKWGFALGGYYADKRNSYLEYSDYHKGTFTARADYRFSEKTSVSNSLSWLNYYSDMSGGIDSAMFASKTFRNLQTFTYRKVDALRMKSTLTQQWNDDCKTTVTLIYRDNTIEQNPAYRIKDDYRKQGNTWVGRKDVAHGEINNSSFHSYAMVAQHKQNFNWKDAVVIGGVNVDLSPSSYNATYIKVKKDTLSKKYSGYQSIDSTLTDYSTRLNNYAAFLNVEFSPVAKLRVVASLRYDYFDYNFDNHLTPSAFSGSPDTVNHFTRVSPKIGFTYSISNGTGFYANYSQGFVPPQVTEMYTGVKVPNLNPSIFYNYEVGGWMEIIHDRLSIDVSSYRLEGTNEIVSVRLDNGTNANQNAGKTSHKGIEAGINSTPLKDISFRFSGAYSKHEFVEFVEKGTTYNGNEMNNAPNWMYNTELWYRPSYVKGLGIGAELQHIGSYFMDPQNTAKYSGYNVLHLRARYQVKEFEIWVNVMNATNNYYSNISSKSASGHSYTLAEPRNFNIGVAYDFGNLFRK